MRVCMRVHARVCKRVWLKCRVLLCGWLRPPGGPADKGPDMTRAEVFAQAKVEATALVKREIKKEAFGCVACVPRCR